MGNTLSLVSNKVQYEIYKFVSDPKAAKFAKEQQDKADKDKADKEKADTDLKSKKQSEPFEDDPKAEAAAKLSARSKTDTKKLVGDTAFWTVIGIMLGLILILGIFSANDSIGYGTGFRIFWLFYGPLWTIYSRIKNYFTKDKNNKIDTTFTSWVPFPIDYNETDFTIKARNKIIELYKDGAPDYEPTVEDYKVGDLKPKVVSKPIISSLVPVLGRKEVSPGIVLDSPPAPAAPPAPPASAPPASAPPASAPPASAPPASAPPAPAPPAPAPLPAPPRGPGTGV